MSKNIGWRPHNWDNIISTKEVEETLESICDDVYSNGYWNGVEDGANSIQVPILKEVTELIEGWNESILLPPAWGRLIENHFKTKFLEEIEETKESDK